VKVEKCPVCQKPGSLHKRYVLNIQKKRFEPYSYVAHYHGKMERNKAMLQGKSLPKISWCYVSKNNGNSLSNKNEEGRRA